jgi:hypothetical protein
MLIQSLERVGSPVVGSRKSLSAAPSWWEKSNMLRIEPARTSKEWFPMLGSFQLYSMKRRMEVWSVTVLST